MPVQVERSDGDDPGANRAVIGERQTDSLSKVINDIPSDPDLLPPRSKCILAASKLTCFLDKSHATISTSVTRISHKRQDFLIIGMDRNSTLGLIVYPSIVSANRNEEITVLAKALQPPLTIAKNTPIAKAIALPVHAMEQVMPVFDEKGFPFRKHVEVHTSWIKHIDRDRPTATYQLTCEERTIIITGMLDMGANVTVIS